MRQSKNAQTSSQEHVGVRHLKMKNEEKESRRPATEKTSSERRKHSPASQRGPALIKTFTKKKPGDRTRVGKGDMDFRRQGEIAWVDFRPRAEKKGVRTYPPKEDSLTTRMVYCVERNGRRRGGSRPAWEVILCPLMIRDHRVLKGNSDKRLRLAST